ncbi:hypothetical protein A1O3_02980 [Capronia epimyces CBS 606.96]|uniref:Uncharacterized protein n=1 Tax=Capronia epimyces CBS 606.96 TaxID=1182542 RepID=W9YBP8_9EURO|nr:uncharacterized protein A1O3_02980 [Capronia epimyces CBS 606.96]EXJ89913.1 hypothetical protein A1O3_02980 [Capronia epimyces CBS 606.96]
MWACCQCHDTALIVIAPHCPGCHHKRCVACRKFSVKPRVHSAKQEIASKPADIVPDVGHTPDPYPEYARPVRRAISNFPVPLEKQDRSEQETFGKSFKSGGGREYPLLPGAKQDEVVKPDGNERVEPTGPKGHAQETPRRPFKFKGFDGGDKIKSGFAIGEDEFIAHDFAIDDTRRDVSVVPSHILDDSESVDQKRHMKKEPHGIPLKSFHGGEESKSSGGRDVPVVEVGRKDGIAHGESADLQGHAQKEPRSPLRSHHTGKEIKLDSGLISPDAHAQAMFDSILESEFWHAAGTFQQLKYWLLSPPLRPGMIRLKFVCACGAIVWDDYPESMSSRTQRLERDLNRFFRQTANGSHTTGDGTLIRTLQEVSSFCTRAFRDLRFLLSSQKHSPTARSPDAEASSRPGAPQATDETSFYLTCVLNTARIPALIHTQSAAIYSDLEYFDALRTLAKSSRASLVSIFNPRKVVAIAYVKFELLFDNEHVEIRKAPDFPLDPEHYQPCKAEFERDDFCPWGPNTLLHFFERRHRCSHHPNILARIPRKLKEKLAVSDHSQPGIGWGMQLVCDVDRFRVGIMGVVGLVVSSVMGILWAKLHGNDVQGGTGLAQCLMMFVPFFVALRGFGNFVEQRY